MRARRRGTEIAITVLAERRQVVEVVIQREIIEYRIVSGTCVCERTQRSTFPAGIEVPVQYGPSGSAFAVYMTQCQLLPHQRTAGVLNELAVLAISPSPFPRLCQANAVVGEAQAQAQDLETLLTSNGEQLRTRYDTILSKAEAGNSPRPRTRGRVKQSPVCNLIRRLHERRNEVLRFLTDRRVPFNNNQAERDLRMPKLKQKASGCFRSDTGAGDFAIIRSYLPTLRKQSDDLFNSLVLTFQGRPPMPQLE